jgi:hypothetical protein
MIVNYASVWSVTYDHNCSFILLATAITVVNYDPKTFILQDTVLKKIYDRKARSKLCIAYDARVVNYDLSLSQDCKL